MVKTFIGLLVAFSLGVACRVFGIPSPAPPLIMGALLVMAMTIGHLLMDGVMMRFSRRHKNLVGRDERAATATGQKVTSIPGAAFDAVSGALILGAGDPAKSSVAVTMPTANALSVRFMSTRVERVGNTNQYKVTGNLSAHGITKQVVLVAGATMASPIVDH
jgi:XapX domain-containing protein